MRQFCSIVDEKPAAVYWQICQFGTVFISPDDLHFQTKYDYISLFTMKGNISNDTQEGSFTPGDPLFIQVLENSCHLCVLCAGNWPMKRLSLA